jgi:2-polyprenyl-6-methoxyphenol hydroxylase-like FAD-dependent oxidoreductase
MVENLPNEGRGATLPRTLDVLVIGAGQAGLALGAQLKGTPLSFGLVECHARVGDSLESLSRKRDRTLSHEGRSLPG